MPAALTPPLSLDKDPQKNLLWPFYLHVPDIVWSLFVTQETIFKYFILAFYNFASPRLPTTHKNAPNK